VRQRKPPAGAKKAEAPQEESRGPEYELVRRLQAVIAAFALDQGVARALVHVEFADGSRFALHTISPEPGLGFVTIVPHAEDLPDVPGALVVPVTSIRRIELDRAEERAFLGFAIRDEAG
jgi:hypothetical protein